MCVCLYYRDKCYTPNIKNHTIKGAVTGKDISALIKRDFGFDVDKRKIVTKSDIKSFGTFTAEARLFTGIVAQFSVKVEEE